MMKESFHVDIMNKILMLEKRFKNKEIYQILLENTIKTMLSRSYSFITTVLL